VIAYPTDYKPLGNLLDWDPVIPMANIELATHEWIGLLIYWLTGKIDALFPAPNQEGMQASQSSVDANASFHER
jgi:hypothetical protein